MAMAPKIEKKVSNHIPDDLFSFILSKLPLKSLKRFTCVCKSWSFLFENPYFLNMFRKNLICAHCSLYNNTCVFLKESVPDPKEHCRLHLLYGDRFENKVELERPPRFQDDFFISDCANGIFALFGHHDQEGVLWNPSTQECFDIPLSPPQFMPSTIAYKFFVFTGFGYDIVRDDYKVIRFVAIYPETNVKVQLGDYWTYKPLGSNDVWEIFSLRSNAWRELDGDFPDPSYCHFTYSQVYFNGVCHWLGGTGDEPSVVKWVVSFNLSSDVFVTTPLLLDGHAFWDEKRQLVLLNGSISLISKCSKTASFHISILGELGVKESWVKLFIIEPLLFIEIPIGVGNKGEIFFKTKDGELVCFDLNTHMFEEIGFKGKGRYHQVAIYKKNLFPIGEINK